MVKKNLTGIVHSSMYHNIQKKGWVSPVDVLMDAGVLSRENYENWRHGRVHYLERVCEANLRKLSEIMKIMRRYAKDNNLKPSWTFYRHWACKETRKLRFSKSGSGDVERNYATHFVAAKAKVEE